MRAHLTRLIVLSFLLLALPLSTIAQDATPTSTLDLSTEAGVLALQAAQREVTAEDVGLPEGFALELVAGGMSFPDAVAVAEDGTIFAALSGFAGTPAQVVVVNPDGTTAPVVDAAVTGLTPPITDIALGPDGTFYVAYAGGIAVVDLVTGAVTPIVTGLPSLGDHQNNQLAFDKDGWVYFGQGTATNSTVVGPDNLVSETSWLPRFPEFSDTPCEDVMIAGDPFESPNVLTLEDPNDVALTSPYQPFGVAVDPGMTIPGAVPCNGAVLRFQTTDPAGTLEVFAWGLRNPFGVTVDPTGAVWVVNNGSDVRGSRPIMDAPDSVYRLEAADAGIWLGFPDFEAGVPVTDPRFAAPGVQPLDFILGNHEALLDGEDAPLQPVATWEPHMATGQAAVAPEGWGGLAGSIFVAHHGDFGPATGALKRSGYAVTHVEQETGAIEHFLQNPNPGPAGGEPERPVGLTFGPDGALYIADLGVIEATTGGLLPRPATGAIWRVIPEDQVGTPAAAGTPALGEIVATPDAEAASPVTQTGGTVEVTETEFAIDMPSQLPAGPTTFVVTNAGTTEHNFEVEGQGIEEAFEQNLQPGETRELQVNLEPGTYEVYCPVGNHEDQGMRLELTVTGS